MKMIVLSIFICFMLLLTACGGGTGSKAVPEGSTQVKIDAPKAKEPSKSAEKSGFQKISDISEAWDELYTQNEKAINNYTGMPMMELVEPGLAFVSGVQYDLLNMDNKEGRFEGKLVLAGKKGFIEKTGAKLTFGYDDVLEKDGFGPLEKAGDRKVENGIFELDKGHFMTEIYTERSGKKINRSYYEFQQLGDGGMICFALSGSTLNGKGDENISNKFVFIRNSKDRYDFVIAKGETGPEFKSISLADEGDLTKERAIEIFKAAGFAIDKTGGIKDGTLVVD